MSAIRRVPRPGADSNGSQSRSVTTTYAVLSTVLLVTVASMALIVKPPAPPALAEFAPQAQETIDEGPQDQSSRFGTGGSGRCAPGQTGCGGVGVGVPPSESGPEGDAEGRRPIIEKARVKPCVGDPPRQIEDPQSPPCADYWEGPDNGGATYRGVTANEIRVAMDFEFYYEASNSPARFEWVRGLIDFFNRRFEFYGRNITLVERDDIYEEKSEAFEQRASADYAAEAEVFAYIDENGRPLRTWRKRLAEHGIISITPVDGYLTEAELAALHPYAWTYSLTWDRIAGDLAELVCGSLRNRPAVFGGPDVQAATRKFGVAFERANEPYVDISLLVEALKSCEVPTMVREFVDEQSAAVIVADFRKEGVTTIIPVPLLYQSLLLGMQIEATKQAYEPEWLLTGGGPPDFYLTEGRYGTGARQTAHQVAMFGDNRFQPVAERPSTWALDEQGVDNQAKRGNSHSFEYEHVYRSLLLLASGIQAAGPNLTPASFARGLQRLRFPNPGAGAAPYYQATVGFTGDHSMVGDEAVAWWNPTLKPMYDADDTPGSWCYLDRGKRWRLGQWPEGLTLFDPGNPCR